jgi:hypothetical protein
MLLADGQWSKSSVGFEETESKSHMQAAVQLLRG